MILLRLQHWLRQHGALLPAGLLLLLVAAVLHGIVVQGFEQQIQQQETRRAELAAQLAAPVPNTKPAPMLLETRLQAFRTHLADKNKSPQLLHTLFDQAKQSGLTLKQAEYKMNFDKTGDFYVYQITLPVKGSYINVRRFAQSALEKIPTAALDDVAFKRDAIGSETIEAHLKFSFFLTGKLEAGKI